MKIRTILAAAVVLTLMAWAAWVSGAHAQTVVAGAANPYHLSGGTTASTNAQSVRSMPSVLYGGELVNTTATLGYLKLYDLATTPTCSSATGVVAVIPVPASTSGAAVSVNLSPYAGLAFYNGLGYCVTGGGADNDNTSAPAGIYITLALKP